MNDDNGTSPEDFQSALLAELEVPPATDDTTPPAPAPGNDEGDGGDKTTPPAAEAQVPPTDDKTPPEGEPEKPQGGADEAAAADAGKQETEEEKANRLAEEAANKEEPKPLTAEDIRKAIAEDRSESQARVDKVHTAREEIISKVYPEGIDQKIYDTNGNVIKDAQDIVDRGLINDRTGEPYTYEEAASFMLSAGKQMAENVEKLNDWADSVAEQNISLIEGNQRVMEKWGDVLTAMPNLAKELAEKYITKQLEFDTTASYITRMSMTPEEFYDTVMPPYRKLAEALAAQNNNPADSPEAKAAADAAAAAAAEAAKKEQQENEQRERNGLPPQRGQSDAKANTGDPMLDALVDELNKG